MEDLELDADGQQNSGAPQAVRKSISLNLTKKTKLKTKSSVKSSKSRKDRRDRGDGEDIESKSSRRSKSSSEKRKDTTDEDDREDEELDWSHKVLLVGEKVQNPMIHICEICTLPILIYGRLSPCKHVFCLSCAEESNGACSRCDDRIDRIEPAGIGQIFVCSFGGSRNGVSGCRRSYLSQRDLIAHIKHRHEKEGSSIPDSELMRQQGVVRMPFLNAPPGMIVQPGISMQNTAQSTGLGNAVVLTGLQPGTQQPIVVDPNRVPLLMGAQAQFSSLPQGITLTQPQFQGAAYIPHSQNQFQTIPTQISTGLQSAQANAPRQADLQSSGMTRVTAPQQGISIRSQADWRNNAIPTGQDWSNQGRSGNYPQSYYK